MTRPTIAQLPCGCAIDPEQIQFHPQPDGKGYDRYLVVCGWCDAVFTGQDFRDWVQSGSGDVFIQPSTAVLMQQGCVFEVMGLCGHCSRIMVRPRGGKDVMHLEADCSTRPLVN